MGILKRHRLHIRPSKQACVLFCVGWLGWSCINIAFAQQQTVTPNYKDADLAQIVEAVSAITGKTFIVDPRVRAQVTMLSTTAMSPSEFYEAFLSILQVHGFVAVKSGNVIKIIPDSNARQVPSNDLPNTISSGSDQIVTQVIAVNNVSAAQLVPILRPLIPQYGQLAAYTPSNTLIITDHAQNVNRMMRIIERIDRANDEEIEYIQLQNATAAEIVKVVNSLAAASAAAQPGEPAGQRAQVVADDRTNSILLSGDKAKRLRIKTLIAYLDTPLQNGGNTQVRYLRYADAEEVAKKLKEQIQSIAQIVGGEGAPGAPPTGQNNNSVSLWADKGTNALIASAPPKVMQQIMAIVDKIDIRRAQVHIEAIMVEIKAEANADLGVNWAAYGNGDTNTPVGAFNDSKVVNLSALGTGVATKNLSLPSGVTFGVGRVLGSGTDFALVLRALQTNTDTNIISTPSIITMDNQEAKIEVAQEVPFVTGQYTNTGTSSGSSGGLNNPFQTIQRQNVGNILKITPQINEGDSIILTIEQESSALSGTAGAVDIITNKRTINTKVIVEDGGIIVLGGLLEENVIEGETRVPILGSIPIIGNLFRTRSTETKKTNLMVFIRPTILRDAIQTAFETNAKYNLIRDQQHSQNNGKVRLLPSMRRPTLPALEEILNPPAHKNTPASIAEPQSFITQPTELQPTAPKPIESQPTESQFTESSPNESPPAASETHDSEAMQQVEPETQP